MLGCWVLSWVLLIVGLIALLASVFAFLFPNYGLQFYPTLAAALAALFGWAALCVLIRIHDLLEDRSRS